MKITYLAGAAAAALTLGLIGFEASVLSGSQKAAPFINPLTIARSACGRNSKAALQRKLYFEKIGAAWAATLSPEDAAAPQARMRPVPGISYRVTANDKAQFYFDAALAHSWNFNHGEAINEFKLAQAEDADCAMCFWGEAFAWGPNINAPMSDEAVAPAFAAARKAVSLKAKASEKERDLIDAIALRYSSAPLKDRSALDAAFADAMEKVAAKYPDDDFIQSLSAEANMDTQPWDYWMADGRTPKGRAAKTVSLIEAVLARNPDYQPAIHLYIHMTEATDNPYRAAKYADELARLSPGLGHLIHMPAHTYARIGRFKESIATNAAAVKADEAFLDNSNPSPLYQYGYYVHNIHFLMTSAQSAGDAATALEMAKKLDAKLPAEMAVAVPFSQPIKVAPYYAMVQFSSPDEILALEDPGKDVPFMRGIWHYARGEAFAKKGDAESARAEAVAISDIIAKADLSGLIGNQIPALGILKVAHLTVIARAAAAEGDMASAVEAMEEAVAEQDMLPYTEPAYWYYPARQTLGAMVLRAGDSARAEQLFMQALTEVPANGWAMAGLAEAYRTAGNKDAAKYAGALLKKSWISGARPTIDRL
ncbi:MAG: hypothetical protein R3C60_13415 [Parvularculaceae bacterium]